MATEFQPYVGLRPFEVGDKDIFFGRDHEASELLSLITAHPTVLLYAASGAGKSSLLNAKLRLLLEAEGFEILPVARVGRALPKSINADQVANPYLFNVLMSWTGDKETPEPDMSLTNCLGRKERRPGRQNLPQPRIAIFDQFEEIFTTYPERWQGRTVFFEQVRDALEGSPVLLRARDLKDPGALIAQLRNAGDPLSAYFQKRFSEETLQLMETYSGSAPESEALIHSLMRELNRVIQSASLYRGPTGMQAPMTPEMLKLVETKSAHTDLLRLNRMLLETAFPDLITRSVPGDPLLRVLFIMREDYIALLDPYCSLLPEKASTRFHLERLRENTALMAIKGPLKLTDRRFAEGVAEELVKDLRQANVKTPEGRLVLVEDEFIEPVQLQVVCQTLWQELPAGVAEINHSHLEKSGDVNEALAKFYERCVQKTAEETKVKEGILRRWFEEVLITPANTRATVFRGDKEVGGVSNDAVNVLERMYIIKPELRGGQPWYELTHDRLIEPIQNANKTWRAQRAGAVLIQTGLEARASKWVGGGRQDKDLLKEVELPEAEDWLRSEDAANLGSSRDLKALVDASRTNCEKLKLQRERQQTQALLDEQKQRAEDKAISAKRITRLAIWLAIVGLIALLFAYKANSQKEEALRQTEIAKDAETKAKQQTVEATQAKRMAEAATADARAAEKDAQKAEDNAIKAATEAIKAKTRESYQRIRAEEAEKEATKAASEARSAEASERLASTNAQNLHILAVAQRLALQATQTPDEPGVLLAKEAFNLFS